MFRAMRRFKQSFSEKECKQILSEEKRATLAVNGDDGYPYAVPINYFFDEETGKVFFHTASVGHKMDAVGKCDKVCLTVFEKGDRREDWSYYVRSVVLFGRAKIVSDEKTKAEKAKLFGMKYYPTEEELNEELKRDLHRVTIVEITIEHMTGKLVHEK